MNQVTTEDLRLLVVAYLEPRKETQGLVKTMCQEYYLRRDLFDKLMLENMEYKPANQIDILIRKNRMMLDEEINVHVLVESYVEILPQHCSDMEELYKLMETYRMCGVDFTKIICTPSPTD